jgi:poly(beta-D-mannuronate) lyase
LAFACRAASFSSVAELNTALAAAKPGDTITLRNGEWRDAALVVRTAGVTLQAETPGKVRLTGASSLVFAAPSITATGIAFENGALTRGAVIAFRSHHGRLLDSAIVNYNPRNPSVEYSWVSFEGADNAVDRCLFEGKNHAGVLVSNASPDARRNRVTGSIFRNTAAGETLRIAGEGDTSFTIEANLFDHSGSISLVSSGNQVARNTIRAGLGGIEIGGELNTVFGNVILCDARKGAYGMKIAGRRHTVSTNYIERCDSGITLTAASRQVEIEHNTVMDSAAADLVFGGDAHHIAENTFVKTGGGVSLEGPAAESNRFEGNLVSGGEVRLTPAPSRGLTVWKSGGVNVPSAKPLSFDQAGPVWSRRMVRFQ